ncbi:hypothetical protein GGU10DRAFT_342926 [Lentinula aff. detonsa]|uniref:C2 domain-containing protein n=1 Tax=Lentinula aff. detonsa TaxID=2804958 RepID=A0AA38NR72_9AGAR|nr:hypothetical protein GGU10DRAFT_342926 [Lentinula aff. detonsa]
MIQLLDMNSATSIQFCVDECESESSQRVQVHVIGTRNFVSTKLHGKRPSNLFVGMRVFGDTPKDKIYLSTSPVKCKSADEPEWHDNLGPAWLSPRSSISFSVKTRSKFSKTTTVLASTESYTLKRLRKMQGSMDRISTIALPLRSQSSQKDFPVDGVLIINLRELSTSNSGMEEYTSLKSAGSQRSSLEDEQELNLKNPLSPVSIESRFTP